MKEIWLVAIEVEAEVPNSLNSFLGDMNDYFEKSWPGMYKALVAQIEWTENMRSLTMRKGEVIEVGEPAPRPSKGDLLDQFHELAARRKS